MPICKFLHYLLLEACTDVETSLLKPMISKVCLLRGRSGMKGAFAYVATCAYMQYTEPKKTEGRKQKTIKEELKTCSFQTRTHKDKKITLQSQHLRSGSQNTNIEAHWIPASISYTEIKTMPKPLTIIRGSLYKRAEASCNKSLGSSRKWKNNVRREERGGKKKKKPD